MASKAVLQNTSYNDLYRNICLFSVPLSCRVASLAHRQGRAQNAAPIVPTATATMAENVSEVSKTIWPLATEVGIEKTLPFPKQLYPINIKVNSIRTVRGGTAAAAAAAKETTRNSFNNIQMCPSSPVSALTTYNQYHAYIQCNTHLIFR